MQKAKLIFSPLEQEYNRLYGRYPDYDYYELRSKYGSAVAGQVRQERIDKAWNSMKQQEHKRIEQLRAECPF